MRTLVVGCDASGKSTFLAGIRHRYGDTVRESTRSDEVVAFKQANIDREIDSDFIDEREAFYLKIEQQELELTRNITHLATTNSRLITLISHDVMRRCIGLEGIDDTEILTQWLDNQNTIDANTTDIIAFTHASPAVIAMRIRERQKAGMQDERFWGFNSLFFLEQYQERWRQLMPKLAQRGFRLVSLDTENISPEDLVELYDDVRREIE